MNMIYLACPYSHADPKVKQARYEFVTMVAGWLCHHYVVFSPITHSHAIEELWTEGVKSWDFWQKQDLPIIDRCDAFWVLRIPGWDKSIGVRDEMIFARGLDIPRMWLDIDELPENLKRKAADYGFTS